MTRRVLIVFLVLGFVASSVMVAYAYGYAPHIVREAQLRLNRMGYGAGPPDGQFGPRTRNALRRYQWDNGLPADGQLNPPTLRSLGMPPPPRPGYGPGPRPGYPPPPPVW